MWCCARCGAGGGGAPFAAPAAPTASVRLPLAAPVPSAIAGVWWAEVAREGDALATAHVEMILAQRWRCGTALARRQGARRCGLTAAGGFGLDQLVVARRTDEARRNLEQRLVRVRVRVRIRGRGRVRGRVRVRVRPLPYPIPLRAEGEREGEGEEQAGW